MSNRGPQLPEDMDVCLRLSAKDFRALTRMVNHNGKADDRLRVLCNGILAVRKSFARPHTVRSLVTEWALRMGAHGFTCDELLVALALPEGSCAALCANLYDSGVLDRTKKFRKARSGVKARVYRITDLFVKGLEHESENRNGHTRQSTKVVTTVRA